MVLLALANMGLLLISFLIGLRRREGAIPDQPESGPALDQFTGPQGS
jgi:hypothetical protein